MPSIPFKHKCLSIILIWVIVSHFFFTFLYLGKTDMVFGKKVAIFDWEWGQNSTPRDGQIEKIP